MNSKCLKQLQQLTALGKRAEIKVSIFLPITDLAVSEEKILTGLLATANKLLVPHQTKLRVDVGNLQRWRTQGASTLAIYACGGEQLVVPLPFRLEPRVIVAKSFHVKPLVAAYENFLDAVLVHFHDWGATVFRLTEHTVEKVDTYLPPGFDSPGVWHAELAPQKVHDFVSFIQQQLIGVCGQYTSMVAVTGHGVEPLQQHRLWKSIGVPALFLEDRWSSVFPERSIVAVRRMLTQQIERLHVKHVQAALLRSSAAGPIQSYDDLFQRIVGKQVDTLIVSLDELQFGALDTKTGKTVLHKQQRNAHDDDLLDDMLELAIHHGVKVKVIPGQLLPKGQPFIAA